MVAHAKDGIEDLMFGQFLAFDDFQNGFLKRQFIADAPGWGALKFEITGEYPDVGSGSGNARRLWL